MLGRRGWSGIDSYLVGKDQVFENLPDGAEYVQPRANIQAVCDFRDPKASHPCDHPGIEMWSLVSAGGFPGRREIGSDDPENFGTRLTSRRENARARSWPGPSSGAVAARL
jgi:hypothetical protein